MQICSNGTYSQLHMYWIAALIYKDNLDSFQSNFISIISLPDKVQTFTNCLNQKTDFLDLPWLLHNFAYNF